MHYGEEKYGVGGGTDGKAAFMVSGDGTASITTFYRSLVNTAIQFSETHSHGP